MTDITVSTPFFDNSPNDHTAVLMVVSVVCSVLMVGIVTIKILVQRQGTRRPTAVIDTVLYAGAALMLAQTSCIIAATDLGLGKDVADESPHKNKILTVGKIPLLRENSWHDICPRGPC